MKNKQYFVYYGYRDHVWKYDKKGNYRNFAGICWVSYGKIWANNLKEANSICKRIFAGTSHNDLITIKAAIK